MGKVYLVGAGPGDPDLLTLKAARLLQTADVVLHDALVGPGVLALIPKHVQIIDIGKRRGQKLLTQHEINSLLIAYSRDHSSVVRLKGGDPMLFGRAGEEIAALRESGVDFEIVPGISAAFGAAATAQIPLTDRRFAAQLLFTTARRTHGDSNPDWKRILSSNTTAVIYMPGGNYSETRRQLLDAGLQPHMPAVVVSAATLPHQHVHRTTIAGLADIASVISPSLLIVGEVARH